MRIEYNKGGRSFTLIYLFRKYKFVMFDLKFVSGCNFFGFIIKIDDMDMIYFFRKSIVIGFVFILVFYSFEYDFKEIFKVKVKLLLFLLFL